VDKVDFTDYDLSGLTPVRFEFRRKDTQLNLRVPEALLDKGKARASGARRLARIVCPDGWSAPPKGRGACFLPVVEKIILVPRAFSFDSQMVPR
jgi:hypothetical protein